MLYEKEFEEIIAIMYGSHASSAGMRQRKWQWGEG